MPRASQLVVPGAFPDAVRRASSPQYGLAHWMDRVLVERDRAGREFSVDSVHDLRVALRRCRSMARVLMAVDPDPEWRAMRKAGRRLFRDLGEVRDVHVMRQWIESLAPPDDPVRVRMLGHLAARERALRAQARDDVAAFSSTAWRRWRRILPARALRVPSAPEVFRHLALERCLEARALHRLALRDRTRTAYHRVRIGLKRFRYTVENFLPDLAGEWEQSLKALQDRLGEVHDLDVLWAALPAAGGTFDAAARARWRARIEGERAPRIEAYRAATLGAGSVWAAWLSRLGDGQATGTATLGAWASFRDADFAGTRRIAACALDLFDAFGAAGVHDGRFCDARARRVLHAAALVHRVGRADRKRGHHKTAHRMIREVSVPTGWTDDDMRIVALTVRYHRGGPPRRHHAELRGVAACVRTMGLRFAAILRLAIALERGGHPPTRLAVLQTPEGIVLEADADEERAAEILRSKWMLEVAYRRTAIVRRVARDRPASLRRSPPTRRAHAGR